MLIKCQLEHFKKEIHLDENATISDLSKEIQNLSGMTPEYQILVFKENDHKKRIKVKKEAERPLSDFGLTDDSEVEFRGNLSGGCGCSIGCGCEIL